MINLEIYYNKKTDCFILNSFSIEDGYLGSISINKENFLMFFKSKKIDFSKFEYIQNEEKMKDLFLVATRVEEEEEYADYFTIKNDMLFNNFIKKYVDMYNIDTNSELNSILNLYDN